MTTVARAPHLIDHELTSRDREYDGVICFGGEDWWYHNHGHYDLQIMQRFSRRVPVLYVNSIGMRVPRPSEGQMFLRRVRRKLNSLTRGLVRIDDRFAVLSPITIPGRAAAPFVRSILPGQVRRAAARVGIRRPLLWVVCPTAAEVVDALDPVAVAYQRTDRYECFGGVDQSLIREYDLWLKKRADLTVFCSSHLLACEQGDCRRARLVDHGVDALRFAEPGPEPKDVAGLPRPRVGFVGGIDEHTFDAGLFREVLDRLHDAHFVLVGACSLPADWCRRSNVVLLGQRPYAQVPAYMGACDVLMMPWRRSRWIEACHPVKLKEYLAAGRPVVSTPFPELRRFEGLVEIAEDAPDFARTIRQVLDRPFDPVPGREHVKMQSWASKVREIRGELERLGIVEAGRPSARRPARSLPSVAVPAAAEARTSLPRRRTHGELAGCLLLAGGVASSPLSESTGRSVLDLWLTRGETVLGLWWRQLGMLGPMTDGRPPVRVIYGRPLPPPCPSGPLPPGLTLEAEPSSLRGPAGTVRDCCTACEPDQQVLVLEAGRYFRGDLVPMLAAHRERGADVTVAANTAGRPSGVYLIRCATLQLIPPVGFFDIKEQWLRRARQAGLRVLVHRMPTESSIPLRSRAQFIRAARLANGWDGAGPRTGLLGGEHRPGQYLVCEGAFVGPNAVVTDSVIMPGAIVGAGAVLVRSVVCPDAVVPAGNIVCDTVVPGPPTASGRLERCA